MKIHSENLQNCDKNDYTIQRGWIYFDAIYNFLSRKKKINFPWKNEDNLELSTNLQKWN